MHLNELRGTDKYFVLNLLQQTACTQNSLLFEASEKHESERHRYPETRQ